MGVTGNKKILYKQCVVEGSLAFYSKKLTEVFTHNTLRHENIFTTHMMHYYVQEDSKRNLRKYLRIPLQGREHNKKSWYLQYLKKMCVGTLSTHDFLLKSVAPNETHSTIHGTLKNKK